ncbi:ATP-grasp domain-containing protein, partial [Candidatus Peregrinibacteria bacterium]|nr:ATP-grasp domain-containing protein [Candidatus Peregrinibacteria bacterium]
ALEAVEKFLQENPDIKIDGVLTFWEDDVLLTSRIADKFGLIGVPYKVAQNCRNKFLFRRFCEKNAIPCPRYVLIHSEKDLDAVIRQLTFPVVLKPVFGSSSAFVVKVEDKDELPGVYKYLKENVSPQIESALADGTGIFAEEYIDGDEIDIEMLVQNGKVKFSAVIDNYKISGEPFFMETAASIPSNLPEATEDELCEMAEEVLEKLGVQNGCIHFEAKSTKTGPMPLEVNLRMGGDEVFSAIKAVYNTDFIVNAAGIALGLYIPKVKKPEEPKKCIVAQYFQPEDSGILSKLWIDPELEKKDYLEELQIFKGIGDTILIPPQGFETLGWMTVSGNTHVDAQNNLNEALKSIRYEVVKFKPTSSIGKTTRKNHFSVASLGKAMTPRGAKIEKIRQFSLENQRNLHIGIACNIYSGQEGNEVEKDLMSVGKNIEKALLTRGYKVTFFDLNDAHGVFSQVPKSNVDFIFNVCERVNDSSLLEPHAAALFDVLQMPYTGSNPFTLALCIDKIRMKKLLHFHGIPTPRWDYAYEMDDEISDDLRFPLIVKPATTDNSIGITNESVVTDKKQLQTQLERVILDIKCPALVEEFIEGDEYDVSVLGNEEDDLRALPLMRTLFDKMPAGYWHILPYNAKWDLDPVYSNCVYTQRPPKNISKKLASLITELGIDTYNILGCHDYGRVEIRVDKDDNPYVLELNPNPSINRGDCVPGMAELAGMDYADFIEEIIRLAIKRYKNKPPYYHLQSSYL